jgi:hypothetical protein
MDANRRRSFTLLAALACATAPSWLSPRTAAACGMVIFDRPDVSPTAAPLLLVAATQRLTAGALPAARRLAERVARSPRVARAQRAEAWTMVAWIDWRLGARPSAQGALKRARVLDEGGATVERVIARSGSRELQASFRAAITG